MNNKDFKKYGPFAILALILFLLYRFFIQKDEKKTTAAPATGNDGSKTITLPGFGGSPGSGSGSSNSNSGSSNTNTGSGTNTTNTNTNTSTGSGSTNTSSSGAGSGTPISTTGSNTPTTGGGFPQTNPANTGATQIAINPTAGPVMSAPTGVGIGVAQVPTNNTAAKTVRTKQKVVTERYPTLVGSATPMVVVSKDDERFKDLNIRNPFGL